MALLVSLFGPNWHRSGALDAKITGSVVVDDTIQAKAQLISRNSTSTGEQFVLDVWCENGVGQKIIVGQAQGTLDPLS